MARFRYSLVFVGLLVFGFGIYQSGVFDGIDGSRQVASVAQSINHFDPENNEDNELHEEEVQDAIVSIAEVRPGQENQSIEVVVQYAGQPNHIIVGHSQDASLVFSGNLETFEQYLVDEGGNGTIVIPVSIPSVCGGTYYLAVMAYHGEDSAPGVFLYDTHSSVLEYELPWNICQTPAGTVSVLDPLLPQVTQEGSDEDQNGQISNNHVSISYMANAANINLAGASGLRIADIHMNTLSFRVNQRTVDARFSFTHRAFSRPPHLIVSHAVVVVDSQGREFMASGTPFSEDRRDLLESVFKDYASRLEARKLSFSSPSETLSDSGVKDNNLEISDMNNLNEGVFQDRVSNRDNILNLDGKIMYDTEMSNISRNNSVRSVRTFGFYDLTDQQKIFTETEGVYALSLPGLACSTQYQVSIRVTQELSRSAVDYGENIPRDVNFVNKEVDKESASDILTFVTPECNVRPASSTSIQVRVDNLIKTGNEQEAISLKEQYKHLFPDVDISGNPGARVESVRPIDSSVQNTMIQTLDEVQSGLYQARESGEEATRAYLSVIKQALEYIQTLLADLFL